MLTLFACTLPLVSRSIRPTKHDERCMLWLAKQRWQQEVGQQIQALQQLAAGSNADDKQSRSIDSRERETTRGDRDRGEKDRQTETDDSSSDSDNDSDSDQDNPQSHAMDYIPPLPLSAQASTGADEMLPSVNPTFPFPASATSFSQFNIPQHSFTLPSTVPTFPISASHSFDTAAYDPDPPAQLPPLPAEQQICALFAIHTDYGLPAFADSGVLLGFCVDQEAAGVVFYPLSAYGDVRQYPRIAEDGREVSDQYRDAVRSGSSDVVWKKDWVDLDKLKEEAVLLLYTKNRGTNNNNSGNNSALQRPISVGEVAY